MSISHYRELDVWRLAMSLAKQTYQLTASFPREERFGLTSQLQRSAVSIPSNIAEGNARHSTRDYARFVSMSLGSCAELQTQLLLTGDLDVGDAQMREAAIELCDRVGQMLQRLHQSLIRRLRAESPVPSPESRS
ncbi:MULTISPECIES: four helix bundle protein [unclassified Lysobacter]|uniref:four helix bundle protein n=1 Tax=unclassified Lysobacter TaxID=2635362 RepID=UPI001BEB3DF0|nr:MULTISPECIES: four helix bundle protein [unclassified Lysobacter]MBT2745323.1 four helix bundle protein [Lysobacter sp. ISL-42]MBT2751920.1 four helix bundle protein [Lysobacter sp. ISL-50]MBT2777885.1 four helix bundle protein [Lysobacter sp. ISL-54]MBT2783141.1 four helix bundle protein [Lysobacter sp. ISL-52]